MLLIETSPCGRCCWLLRVYAGGRENLCSIRDPRKQAGVYLAQLMD